MRPWVQRIPFDESYENGHLFACAVSEPCVVYWCISNIIGSCLKVAPCQSVLIVEGRFSMFF
jgi:hypothetical protein